MTDKIAKEMAEQEFDRFAEAMDLNVDTTKMDLEDKQGFTEQHGRLINAIQKGSLVINDNGEPVFTPQRTQGTDPITFYEPTGASLMAMDRKKQTEDIAKMFAAMGDITKTHANIFSKMRMSDLKVCMAITMFFLG